MRIELVIPRGYASKLLEAAEQPLDGVALGVAVCVVGPRSTAFTPGRDDGAGAAGGERGDQWVGVVAPVGDEISRGQVLKQRQGLRRVVALTGRQA